MRFLLKTVKLTYLMMSGCTVKYYSPPVLEWVAARLSGTLQLPVSSELWKTEEGFHQLFGGVTTKNAAWNSLPKLKRYGPFGVRLATYIKAHLRD